ncbi:MAG TPA: ABC transporter permease subunit [Streptosporangiaceae bacterium]|nr:ABC transporter permease subunit [Streptosporangiaceae bacterium]
MIWLTWRQFRAQSIAAGAFVVAFGVVLLVSGIKIAHAYSSAGVPGCHGAGACANAATTFIDQLRGSSTELIYYTGIVIVYLAPALMGMFWGAPLVARELETGTFRLAWNQSVSRTRWVVAKLGLIWLAAMATAGLLSLVTGSWASPIFRAGQLAGSDSVSLDRLAPQLFGAQGIAPIGYAAFAFALGVAAGVFIRHTIPAMAVTLVGFGLVQLAWPSWVRPHLAPQLRQYLPITGANVNELVVENNQFIVRRTIFKPGGWVVSNQTVNPAGRPFGGAPLQACVSGPQSACNAAVNTLHLRTLISYVPARGFWELQWIEAGIFVVLAAALTAFCAWWIRNRQLT